MIIASMVEQLKDSDMSSDFEALYNPRAIKRVYSGKRGCMCGCLGTWIDVKPVIVDINDDFAAWRITDRKVLNTLSKLRESFDTKWDENANCYWLEVGNKMYAAYTK